MDTITLNDIDLEELQVNIVNQRDPLELRNVLHNLYPHHIVINDYYAFRL